MTTYIYIVLGECNWLILDGSVEFQAGRAVVTGKVIRASGPAWDLNKKNDSIYIIKTDQRNLVVVEEV